ncbi:MAG: LamG-like jellyroll fold domain-containing protein [Chitinophagaceae bacterium]
MRSLLPFYKKLLLICFSFFSIVLFSNAQSLRFTDTSYVNLGNQASLKLTNFTLEAWIKIEGYGSTTETGSTGAGGGQTGVVPIITKGRAEAEAAAVDVNYFLAYRLSDMKLIADFEDNATSLNHSVVSAATLPMNTWIQVGASFDVTTQVWRLFIGGVTETFPALTGGPFTPRSASDVNVCIGSSLNTASSIRPGFFNGRIDEVRIWNTALTALNPGELTSGSGLVGRWGLNEATGSTGTNSVAGGVNGTFSAINPLWVTGFNQVDPTTNASVDFNGVHDYITFGAAPSLNTTAPGATGFTLETWIKIEGTGVTITTGTNGLDGTGGRPLAIPIIAKGRGESETSGLNMNYFLGITSTDMLVADFEEALVASPIPNVTVTGLNHPIIPTGAEIAAATISRNVWTHVAVTYNIADGVWTLYKNGVSVATLNMTNGLVPENISTQHASIGSALTSGGIPGGYFNGKIDEVRIWNKALTPAEILANMNLEITSGTGLRGRWGLNENGNITATNSVGGSVNGTLRSDNISSHPTNGGPVWVSSGYNNQAPNQPINPSPANNANSPSTSPNICATVSDPNVDNLTVRFYGRKKVVTPGSKFTIIGLPDTQFYTEELPGTNSSGGGHNGIFKAQTQWIADHRIDSNVAFVIQLGDCVQNGNNPPGADKQIEWKRADTSMKKIENPNVPITDGIPYGICVGNHDQGVIGDPNSTNTFYNQYFGESRFTGRSYYGGHYGSNNDNHYELFSAGGIDFISISIEYYPDGTTASLQPVLDWADNLLKTNPNRKGIVSSHNILGTGNPASFQGPGQKIYNDLKDNPNFILMLAGHVAGEGRRTDVFGGNTVHTLMADYQSGYSNGGNGYLRIMQFLPALNLLSVKTFSPYSNTSFTGSTSEFTLPVTLTQPFTLIGTNSNVASGSASCVNWPSLDQFTDYEWYVELNDGENTTTGPIWTFTTPANSPLPVNIISFKAKAENNSSVKINWTTTYERDNSHFEIQRSVDAINYTTIGTTQGVNNSNTLQNYTFNDNLPLKGISFYRLKQIDLDNRSTLSKVERVNISNTKNNIDLYPNPVSGNSFSINLQDEIHGTIDIRIFDIKGVLMIHQQFNGANTFTVNHQLAKGIYSVNITGRGFTETKKLIVQ